MIVASAHRPSLVQAQQLTLRVPARCGSVAEFTARVARLAGEQAAQRAEATVVITRRGGDYQLDVTVPAAQRGSRHTDCRVLLETAALIVAFSVNPELAEPAPDALPSQSIASAPAQDSPERPRAPSDVELTAHGELGVLYGVVPALSVPVGLGLRIARKKVGATFALRYVPPVESDGTGPRVRAQAAGASVVAHYAPWRALQAGAGFEVDVLHGRGRAVTATESDVTSRSAVRLELLVHLLSRGRHRLSLAGHAALAVHRASFVVTGFGRVYDSEIVSLSLNLRWALSIR
jgi:hypothetical protein